MALFWVMKNLMGHAVWENQEKDADGEHKRKWRKDMHEDSKDLNVKVESIFQGLGISSPSTQKPPEY